MMHNTKKMGEVLSISRGYSEENYFSQKGHVKLNVKGADDCYWFKINVENNLHHDEVIEDLLDALGITNTKELIGKNIEFCLGTEGDISKIFIGENEFDINGMKKTSVFGPHYNNTKSL